jgi:hypothetical protein
MFKILSIYICRKKYIKCNIWRVAVRPSYIRPIYRTGVPRTARFLKVKVSLLLEFRIASLSHWFPTLREFGDLIFKGQKSNKLLKIRPLRCLETSGIKYPVTRLHIQQARRPQLYAAKVKNRASSYFICAFWNIMWWTKSASQIVMNISSADSPTYLPQTKKNGHFSFVWIRIDSLRDEIQ